MLLLVSHWPCVVCSGGGPVRVSHSYEVIVELQALPLLLLL